ncbi:hypothetical protein D3C75_1331670 [compost metagenome]
MLDEVNAQHLCGAGPLREVAPDPLVVDDDIIVAVAGQQLGIEIRLHEARGDIGPHMGFIPCDEFPLDGILGRPL